MTWGGDSPRLPLAEYKIYEERYKKKIERLSQVITILRQHNLPFPNRNYEQVEFFSILALLDSGKFSDKDYPIHADILDIIYDNIPYISEDFFQF